MADEALVFVCVTQDCEIKCEKPCQRPCRDSKSPDTLSLSQLSLPCALVLFALDTFLAVSSSSLEAVRRVTEVGILDEDYRQPEPVKTDMSVEVHDRCGSSSGFLLLRFGHRQSNPPVSSVPDVQKLHIQTCQDHPSVKKNNAQMILSQLEPIPVETASKAK